MATDSFRQQPAEFKNNLQKGTGTEKIVQDHLKDPNHIITDEHIRNVVVGMSDHVSPIEGEHQPDNKDINGHDLDLPSDYSDHSETNKHLPPNPWAIIQ